MSDVNIEVLLGRTITKIEGAEKNSEEIKIYTDDGYVYTMYHSQDCCESVYVEDITGDIEDIIGMVITEASEISQDNPHASESGTWTFYKLSARHYGGGVCIRWNGESNGYYSEEVDIKEEFIGDELDTQKRNIAGYQLQILGPDGWVKRAFSKQLESILEEQSRAERANPAITYRVCAIKEVESDTYATRWIIEGKDGSTGVWYAYNGYFETEELAEEARSNMGTKRQTRTTLAIC